VLLGKYLGRNHERRLVAVLDRDRHRFYSNNRLTAAYITLQQTVHRPLTRHILDDFPDDALLRSRWREGKYRPYCLAHTVVDFYVCALGFGASVAAPQTQRKCQEEEFFKDQPPVRGRTCFVVLRDRRIIGRHMVPNFLSHIIATSTLAIPAMIINETSLSFLGLGIRPPAISWGVLLQEAQNIQSLALAPWLLIPGLAVILAVLAFNLVGDGLRDAADPYSSTTRT